MPTDDREFDARYLLVGSEARELARWLTMGARASLVRHVSLCPSTSPFDAVSMREALHVTCRPLLHEPTDDGRWQLGTGGFTPEHAAASIAAMLELVADIERAQRLLA